MSKAVEISVASITEEGIRLKVTGYSDYAVLAESVTLDEVFAHPEWRVKGAVHPLEREVPEIAFNLRPYLQALKAMRKELRDLYEEESGCCNRARYTELQSHAGPIRVLDDKITAQRMVTSVAFLAATGVWPTELHKMGI